MADKLSGPDDFSNGDDDSLKRARENGDGKTIDGEWVRVSGSGSKSQDGADSGADNALYVTGTPPGSGPDNLPMDPENDPESGSRPKPKPDLEDDDPFRPPLKRRNMLGRLRDQWLAIHDGGDHFRIGPKQETGQGPREISDAQLREVLMKCVLEKGWNKIYFYKGNAPDLDMSTRASIMLMSLTRPEVRDEHSGKILQTAGPLADAAAEWEALGRAKGKNLNIEAVRGRMDPGDLPACFDPDKHERMRERETTALHRRMNRDGRKARWAAASFS